MSPEETEHAFRQFAQYHTVLLLRCLCRDAPAPLHGALCPTRYP